MTVKLARTAARVPAVRPLDDRLGEALRRLRDPLRLPFWADLEEHHKRVWRNDVGPFLTVLKSVGLRVVIEE